MGAIPASSFTKTRNKTHGVKRGNAAFHHTCGSRRTTCQARHCTRLVTKAGQEEMLYLKEIGVYVKVLNQNAGRRRGKITVQYDALI